jgi:hypothetical protein
VIHGTKGGAWWAPARSILGIYSANRIQKQEVCSTVLSEVDSGGPFPFLYGGRVFLIALRGAGAVLKGEQDRVRV